MDTPPIPPLFSTRRDLLRRMLTIAGAGALATLADPAQALIPAKLDAPDTSKWIEVDISEQRLRAWQGNQLVMTSLTSTGKRNTPTVLGTFKVWTKLVSTRMRGPGYDLKGVPYTMYFHRGYGIHGAYWHNNFGRVMSHGCVNLPVPFSRQLFNWSYVGIKVVVHA
jgi:lipoprotein-anchoring transpeptidase ErfK/SrfK